MLNNNKLCLLLLALSLFLVLTNAIQHKRNFGSSLKREIQTDQIDNKSITLQAIDQLLRQNQIINHNQIRKCFTNTQINKVDIIIEEVFKQLSEKKQRQGLKYYLQLKSALSGYLSKQTINCFIKSNDLKLLLQAYKINKQKDLIKLLQQKNQNIILLIQKAISNSNPSILIQDLALLLRSLRSQDQWGITVSNPHLANYTYYGITISNGLIGAVSQKLPFKIAKTVLAGAYDKYGRGRVDNIVETMNVIDLDIKVNGRGFDQSQSNNYQQYIDFKKAEFSGSYSAGSSASVTYKYSALKNSPSVFYVQTQVTAHQQTSLQVTNHHIIPAYMNNISKTYQNIPNKQIYRVMSSRASTKSSSLSIVLSSAFVVDDESKKYSYQQAHQDWDSDMHLHSLKEIHLKKGQSFKFYLFSSLISTQHHTDPENQAIRLLLKAASTQIDQLVAKHHQLWENLWRNDIIIQGNSQDQKMVRSMLYHFYSFINDFKSYGLSPMGLSGLGYNGHVFWDMDLWMYPGILILNPQLARTLIQYRYQRIFQARNNAYLNGYKGIMFPWQSSKLGNQQTPVWAATGPLQHHITGTVSLAAWNYYCVTQDKQWLKNKGMEIIQGAAQFWESRVQKDQQGKYHINNVVAADQWAENVDDDAFTNGVAIESLKIANKMRQVLGLTTKSQWDQIRLNIVIHRFGDTNVTKQYSTYNGQNIKQADVNLLSFPLKQVVSKSSILADLQYYRTRIPKQGTPAMTKAIFSLLYSRLLDAPKAYQYFKQSFEPNLLQPFNVLAQTQGGTNPYFLTGAGGVIQAVIFGFGGLDITDQGIRTVQTVIPDEWDRLIIKGFNVKNTIQTQIKQQQ